jgi:tetratricopeptide (TPR) repeat protein
VHFVVKRPRPKWTLACLAWVAGAAVGCSSPVTQPDPPQPDPEALRLLARLDAMLSSIPATAKTPEERTVIRTIAELQLALGAEERAIHTLSLIDDRYYQAIAIFTLLYEPVTELRGAPLLSRLRSVVGEIRDFRMGHARTCLALAYAKHGADSDALVELRDYHCNRDDGWLTICKVSLTYITVGRTDQALLLLRNVQCERFQRVLEVVTRTLCNAGKFEEAIDLVKNGLEGASRDSGILEILENAQRHPGLLTQADLVDQIGGEPTRVMALAALSDAHAAAGNASEAKHCLEKAGRLLERKREATGEDTNYLYGVCLLARSYWKAGFAAIASDLLKRVESSLAASDDRSLKAFVGQTLAESRYEMGDVTGAVGYAKTMQGGTRHATLRSITLRLVEGGKVTEAENVAHEMCDNSYEKIEMLLRIAKHRLANREGHLATPLLKRSVELLDRVENPRDGNMTPSPGERTWDDLCCEAGRLWALVDAREAIRVLVARRKWIDAERMAENIVGIGRDWSASPGEQAYEEDLANLLPPDLRILIELGHIGAQVQLRKMRR